MKYISNLNKILNKDYEVLNRENVKEVKIYKGLTLKELIAYLLFNILIFYLLYYVFELSGNILINTITIIMVALITALNFQAITMIRFLKRINVFFDGVTLVFDKNNSFFNKNNKFICLIEKVSKLQIDISTTSSDNWNHYDLYIILKDGSKSLIYGSGDEFIYDIADDIADFFNVKVYVENTK